MEEDFLFLSRNCEEGTFKLNSESGCISCEDIDWRFLTRMADVLNISYKYDEDKQSFCQRISEEAKKQLLNIKTKRQKTSSDNELDVYYNTIIHSNDFGEMNQLFNQMIEVVDPFANEDGWSKISYIRTLYQLDKQQIADIINLLYYSAPLDRIQVASLIYAIEEALLLKKVDLRLINDDVLFGIFQHQLSLGLIEKIIEQDYVDILNKFLHIKRTRLEKQGVNTLEFLHGLMGLNKTLFKLVMDRIPYYGDINFRRQVLYNLDYLLRLPRRGDVLTYLKVAREKLFFILKDYDDIEKLKQKLRTKK